MKLSTIVKKAELYSVISAKLSIGLLHKLRGIGCSGKVLAWFSSYISGRRKRVVLNGKFSKRVEFLAGVPQGSILGPSSLSHLYQ